MALFLWHYNKASDNAIVSWGRHTTRHSAALIAFQLLRFYTAAVVIKITFFFFFPPWKTSSAEPLRLRFVCIWLYNRIRFSFKGKQNGLYGAHLGEAFQQRLELHRPFSQFNFINSEGLYQPLPQQVLKCCCGESSKHYRWVVQSLPSSEYKLLEVSRKKQQVALNGLG